MERIKKYLLVSLGFALAGMIGAAFGTGTAQAVVATLVEVVNPTTSPVQTSSVNVTDPGRIAYQSQQNNYCIGTTCDLIFPTVPANHRVVVQHISGEFGYFSTAPTVILLQAFGNASTPFEAFPESVQNPAEAFGATNADVLMYVDGSQFVRVRLSLYGNSASFVNTQANTVTLTGYELDCTVAACAPIATQ